ncbi:molybdopterin-synthase adenylyltransferase MoeB [Pantoea sp. S62]|nr:molybdopterin-synthase adenylyltransferase MoeB [Pantoea sp. S62]
MLPELSDEEMLRYNRQIVLRGFDFEGQERLKASHALVVGLGWAARLRPTLLLPASAI